MDLLRGYNSPMLYETLNMSDSDFIKWLQDLKLLHLTRICECGGGMSYKWEKDRQYPSWRCTRKICRKKRGFLVGTWFEGTHLTLKEVGYFFDNFEFPL